MSFFIDLSDKRNHQVFKKLKELNYNVFSLEESLFQAKQGDIYIFSPAKKFLVEEVNLFMPKTKLFAGAVNDNVLQIFKEKEIEYINMMEIESFVVKNALLTAEGVLAHIISDTPKSIYQNKIMVIGTGRTGKAIIHLIDRLNLNYEIVTFSKVKQTENLFWQKPILLNNQMLAWLKDFDIIINTAPTKVFEDEMLDCINSKAVVIEIASKSCLNKELAESKGINYISAQSLPQVYSYESAGDLVVEVVLNN